MKHTVVGVDIAKRVFQLHWVDMESGEISSILSAIKHQRDAFGAYVVFDVKPNMLFFFEMSIVKVKADRKMFEHSRVLLDDGTSWICDVRLE